MKMEKLIGVMLFFIVALIVFGLFGTGDSQTRISHVEIKQTNVTNVSTGPEISAYRGITSDEQIEVNGMCIAWIIGLLAFVYATGIVYDEYSNIKDPEKDGEDNE